jgi:hypothetical protein
MEYDGIEDREFEQRVRTAAAAATVLPAPPEAWGQIEARLREGEVVLLPADAPRFRTTMLTPRGLRVAGLVLVIAGAAAAAALPASPVRRWLEELFTSDHVVEPARPPVEPDGAAPNASPSMPSTPETTLVLEPANDGIVVALEAPEQDVSVLVRFVDTGEPEVRATGAAASAQFRSAAGRLTIVNARGGGLVLTIPRTTARVRVEVDGQPYLTKENRQIRVLAPAADTAGSEILLQIRR